MRVKLTLTLFLVSLSCFADIYKLKDKLEKDCGCKLKVTSSHRSPERNKAVGGAKNSYHLKKGMALDLVKTNCPLNYKTIGLYAKKYFNGIIWYKSHIHVDLRPGKKVFFGK